MTLLRRLAALLAFLFASVVAAAQSAPDDIVVTGRSRQMLQDFVDDMSDGGKNGQLARWDNEICPGIIGLERSQAEMMNGRIAEVARTLGLRPAGEGCRATILILFTPDAADLASHLAHLFPISLASEGRARLNRFARNDSAVRWIAKTDLVGGALPNSRLTLATHAELQLMLILVDTKRIGGFSVGELADYVAVIALAHPRFGSRPNGSSILAMFDRPRRPDTPFVMTSYDRAFLSGLYRAPAKAGDATQERSIVTLMKRDLDKDDPH